MFYRIDLVLRQSMVKEGPYHTTEVVTEVIGEYDYDSAACVLYESQVEVRMKALHAEVERNRGNLQLD